MSKIQFNYTVKGINSVRTIIGEQDNIAIVCINTNSIINLIEEMLTEWDMLDETHRKDLSEISRRIAEISCE